MGQFTAFFEEFVGDLTPEYLLTWARVFKITPEQIHIGELKNQVAIRMESMVDRRGKPPPGDTVILHHDSGIVYELFRDEEETSTTGVTFMDLVRCGYKKVCYRSPTDTGWTDDKIKHDDSMKIDTPMGF